MKQLSGYPQDELQAARNAVAEDWRRIGRAIRDCDDYADHVSDAEKDERLAKDLATADGIETGKYDHQFWAWQRITQKLTGESVALLPCE